MDKVALVTGASSGIGEAAAKDLRLRGFTVYAAARRIERLAALETLGIRPLQMDVTDDSSITQGVQRIIAESGSVDILVNNAGYGSYGSVEDVALDEARNQFEVNLFGLARLTQVVLPYMRKNSSGRIINISSMGGKMYEPMGAWYHATKFALEGLSDCLRLELKPFNIHVVIIEPGAIRTEWSGIAADGLEATSGSGAYREQARRVSAVLRTTGADPRHATAPEVVGSLIGKASTVRRPKTRYVVGYGARPLITLRWLLSDKLFDWLMGMVYRRAA
jgi:NAD(P)-dependent dehydrogenase (short-subunit alcohol dehydrogenase family)